MSRRARWAAERPASLLSAGQHNLVTTQIIIVWAPAMRLLFPVRARVTLPFRWRRG
jgi:hypothetical protein